MRIPFITVFQNFLSNIVHFESPQHSGKSSFLFGQPPPLVVVSREYCFETEKEFPIADPSECVKAASMMKGLSPLSGPSFYLVDKISVDKCRVFIFTIDEGVYEKVSKTGWFIVPESLLVKCWLDSYHREKSTHLTYSAYGREYQALAQSGRFKSWHQHNQVDDAFSLAMRPDTFEAQRIELSEAELHTAFKQSLKRLPGRVLLQGFNSQRLKVSLAKVNWRVAALTVASVAALYISLTSAFLYSYNAATQNQLTEQREELNEVFRIQRNLETKQGVVDTLTDKVKSSPPISGAWQVVLALLKPQDIELLTLSYENNTFTVRARAEKATLIVERIAGLALTDNVEIASPVVNSRGREIVTVSFRYVVNAGSDGSISNAE